MQGTQTSETWIDAQVARFCDNAIPWAERLRGLDKEKHKRR